MSVASHDASPAGEPQSVDDGDQQVIDDARRAREQAPPRPSEPQPALPHRPLIDGFRGVLVAVTIAYHLGGITETPGGWVGVSGFFVLSGFLITNLLLTEQRTTGRVSLRRFFERRLRRLAPALLAVVVGTLVAARALGGTTVWPDLRGDGLAALFYVANWRFILTDQSYFASFEPSPLRHLWSLAIEEQFYLVWPLLLVGLVRWVGRHRLTTMLAAGALTSALWMRIVASGATDLSRAYYGTDTRAQELLVGAALAALLADVPGRRSALDDDPLEHEAHSAERAAAVAAQRTRRANVVGFAGLAGFAVVVLTLSASSAATYARFGMLVSAVVSAAVVYGCARTDDGPLARVLGNRPLRALGARSYVLYLVHWPVIVFMAPPRLHWSPAVLDLARVAVALAITELVHRAIERPVHRRTWAPPHPGRALGVAAVFTLGVVVACTVPPPAADPDVAVRATSQAPAVVTVPPPPTTLVPKPFGTRITVLGDSQAFVLLDTVPVDLGLQVGGAHHAGCDIVGDTIYIGDQVSPTDGDCDRWPGYWAQALSQPTDTVVVALGLRQLFDPQVDGERLRVGSPAWRRYFRAAVSHAVDVIRLHTDAPIVWLDVPCYRWQGDTGAREVGDPERLDAVNTTLAEELASHPGTTVAPYRERVCHGDDADRTDDSLRPDGAHLNRRAADETWRWLVEEVKTAQGVTE